MVSIGVVRRGIQLGAVMLLFLPVFIGSTIWFGTYISAQFLGFALTDPLTALEIMAAGKAVWWPLVVSTIPLVIAAAILGRVFCSYICPLHFLLELLPVEKKSRQQFRYSPLVLLAACVVLSGVVGLPVFTILSPIGILLRALLFGVGVEVILLGLILGAEWLWGRNAWCRNVCPLGALYGLIGVNRYVNIAVDQQKCTGCNKCIQGCGMGAIPGGGSFANRFLCTNCGVCKDLCPAQAIQFVMAKSKGKLGEVNSNGAVENSER